MHAYSWGVGRRCWGGGGDIFCIFCIFSDYNIHLVAQEKASIKKQDLLRVSKDEDVFVMRFYGLIYPMGSCRARSGYLTTLLLDRLGSLSGLPVLFTFFRQKLATALLQSTEGSE